MPVALNVYRRHRQDCEVGHPEESRSGEFEERKRGWKRCACIIFASGTLAGKFKRKSTRQNDWERAREIVSGWKDWGGELPALVPETISVSKVTVDRAVKAFLATHAESSAPATQRMYRYMMNRFRKFSELKGYLLLDQWGPIDVREFRASWEVAPNTATKNMTILKSFFEFAVSNEWIVRNPARLIKDLRNRSENRSKERIPFSDEELARMFEACESKYGKTEDEYPVPLDRTRFGRLHINIRLCRPSHFRRLHLSCRSAAGDWRVSHSHDQKRKEGLYVDTELVAAAHP